MKTAKILMTSLAVVFALSATVFAELTLETGENPGELYFLWQDTLTSSGARSHRLSEMSAFTYGYSKALIQSLEILEVRELDTDQELRFNYVVPKNSPEEKTLRDVVWYYPNPIPSGGRVRVQIRGHMVAPRVYRSEPDKVEINYESREGTFVIIPLGYALTYANNPVIVYEKNARTVCSFRNSPLSIIAKNTSSLAETNRPPAISRNVLSVPSISKVQMEVAPPLVYSFLGHRIGIETKEPKEVSGCLEIEIHGQARRREPRGRPETGLERRQNGGEFRRSAKWIRS
jgi:hypothetical protein